MRRSAMVLLFAILACGGKTVAPTQPVSKPVSKMPAEMDVTYGRLFAKDGFTKLSAYAVEIQCFDPAGPEHQRTMTDGQEHSPEMSLMRDPSPKKAAPWKGVAFTGLATVSKSSADDAVMLNLVIRVP